MYNGKCAVVLLRVAVFVVLSVFILSYVLCDVFIFVCNIIMAMLICDVSVYLRRLSMYMCVLPSPSPMFSYPL